MKNMYGYLGLIGFLAAVCLSGFSEQKPAETGLKIGIIGTDTSHVIAFTRVINDATLPEHVPGGKVVAAYKGGSPDVQSSATRVDKFARQLQEEFGVKLVDSIPALCKQVDAVLLESVDGRPHLEQVKPVFAAGLPVFVDKPIAGNLDDCIEIFRLAKAHHVPCFSSSAYRFYDSMRTLQQTNVGTIRGAISYGPCHLEPHHPDLFWYGIHPTEALFTIMGPEIKQVTRVSTPDTDVVTGIWDQGRVGTLRGLRNAFGPHKVIVFGTKKVAMQDSGGDSYVPLVREIMKFFHTGKPPVSARETIAIYAFMEAADESKRQGGVPVSIDAVLQKHAHGKPLPY